MMTLKFTFRNLKVFFRDITNVFFSILAVCIVIGIYVLFLGDIWIDIAARNIENGKEVMDSWVMAGALAIIPVTSCLGAFSAMVDDKVRKIEKDFTCSPLQRRHISGGYILSSYLVGVLMSLIALFIAELYIVNNGGELLSLTAALQVVGMILYSAAFSTVALYFILSFFRSQGAFLTISVVVGVLIGFFTGCYVPVGLLPEGVQNLVKYFPPSHASTVIRQIMMEGPMIAGFKDEGSREWFEEFMGVTYKMDGEFITVTDSLLFIGISLLVFLVLVAVKEYITRKKR